MPLALRVVKLTPIAIAVCESCGKEVHSQEPLEDDALKAMHSLFDAHNCQSQREAKESG